MYIEHCKNHDIYFSKLNYLELKSEFKKDSKISVLDSHLKEIYDRLGLSFGRQEEREYFLDLCGFHLNESRERLKIGVLDAHGSSVHGIWKFRDLFKRYVVQEWINQHDKEYDILLIHVCNPEKVIPKASHPILVVPQGNISIEKSYQDLENLIIMPNKKITPINGRKIVHNPEYILER